MKKNIMIATGLLSAVVPVVLNNESEAVDDLNEVNKNSRAITTMNKIGKIKGVASNDSLNVRKEPTTSSSVVFTLKNATQINIIGQDSESGWYKISYNGNVGFASNRYIDIIGDAYTKYIVTGDINLRKEANWSSEKVAVIKKGETLNVISINGDWAKVNYNNSTYYAPANYLTKQANGTVENVPPNNTNTNTVKYEVVEQDINIRKEPNWSSDKVGVVKRGEILNVISIDGDWAKVSYNNSTCYAPASYLKKANSGDTTPPVVDVKPVEKTLIATVNTDDLNIRAGAGMSYSILAKVNKGDIVLIKENKSTNGWYKVELANGIVGWCYETYIENFREGTLPSNPSNPSNGSNSSSVISGKIATVNTNDLNIRSGADTIYPILAKVNKGDIVLIKESDLNGWYKVQLKNGIIGWCNGLYLENFRQGSITVTPDDSAVSPSVSEAINKVISIARAQIGKPYEYGATGPNSFDCSGLTQYVFKHGANITLPRNSKAQATVGKYVAKSDLQAGDLIFFDTGGSGISHVGLYIGNNEMIHAPSSGKNVQIVKITTSYWVNSYITARRVIY